MNQESKAGFRYATLAFAIWGTLPIYWKFLHAVPPVEVLAHRVIWSILLVYSILIIQKRKDELTEILHDKKSLIAMSISGLLIGTNWYTYIWAVNNDRVLETSMGYFMCPMISILLGKLFFKERINGLMKPAVAFTLVAILVTAAGYGKFPFAGFYLAVSFGFYGLFRKKIKVKPLPGLLIETITLLPAASAYLIYAHMNNNGVFLTSYTESLLLIGTGVMTSLPLLLYVAGASRIRLGTLGNLQYLAPTIAFFIGVFIYNEPLTVPKVITFLFIWVGVILYMTQLYKDSKQVNI